MTKSPGSASFRLTFQEWRAKWMNAFGEPPQRIHLLTGIAGVSFDECYSSRRYFENKGIKIPFIGIEALIKAKEVLICDQDELYLKRLRRLRDLKNNKWG